MKILKSMLPDVLLIVGAAAVIFGVWSIYPPAGYIVGGVLGIVAGIQMARAA